MSLLANYPFFFDSPEYVMLSQMPISEALHLAHPLAHPVSMLLWRTSYLLLGPSSNALSLVSMLFWLMGVVAMASCVPKSRRVIIFVICILLPLPWLVMTNVLVDAVSNSLFMVGVAIIWKQKSVWRVGISTILFSLAIFNYLGMAVWLVVPALMIWFEKQLTLKIKITMIGIISTSIGIAIGGLAVMGLWTTKVGIGLSSVPVALYHGATAFIANYTWVSAVLVFWFGLNWIKRHEWDKLLIMFLVFVIYVISLIPWHSGPYGRLGVFLVFPLAYLYAKLPRWALTIAIVSILPGWFGIVRAYQGTPLPTLQQQLVDSTDCKDKQLIFSEIQRPQLILIYPTAWYVGPANWQEIVTKIDRVEYVCISQQAIDYPYFQFEGQLPYPLSGRSGSEGFLLKTLKRDKFEIIKTDPTHPELTIFGISR